MSRRDETRDGTRDPGLVWSGLLTTATKEEQLETRAQVPRLTGCPMGCPKDRNGVDHHEPPCLVGQPDPELIDYMDSGVFVIRNGKPALSSLREQAELLGLR
jgi:hypothetical protein